MERAQAAKELRELLDSHNLQDWKIRINAQSLDSKHQFLGMCLYRDKTIVLNAHHIDIHPDVEIRDTIRHEVAHALCSRWDGHGEIWQAKATELGAIPRACSSMDLPANVIDAIRSGATVEVDFEEHVIRTAKYRVTRLQDRCPTCGEVAVTVSENTIENDDFTPNVKVITLECGHEIRKELPKATPFHRLVADGKQDCEHVFSGNRCWKCGGYRPFDFQIEGMRFAEAALASANGCLIMDEMGLGKTPQSIGTLVFHKELWPILIIVKSKIRLQWFRQLYRWSDGKMIAQVINKSTDFCIPGLQAYIISFDMLVQKSRTSKKGKNVEQGFDIKKFDDAGIKCVIIDECQHISNPDSSRTQMVRRIVKGRKVVGLSGTPWKNRGSEFFSILNMIDPMKFSSFQGFKDRWVRYEWDGKYRKEGGIRNPQAFKDYIKDIAIRRERKEVMSQLPPMNRMPLLVELEALYQDMYDEGEGDFVNWYNEKVLGGEPLNGIHMLAQMTKMRHAVGLSKIPATMEFLEQHIEENDRSIVVGAHHKDVQDILFDQCKEKFGSEYQILQLKAGGDSAPVVQKFNERKSILIASILAGGEGVDGLQHSCYDLILHERQWNPANEEQFEGRLLRMGQESGSVNGTYIMADGTIDTLFNGIVERKRIYFHQAMNTGEAPVWNQSDLLKELAEAIVANYNRKKGRAA